MTSDFFLGSISFRQITDIGTGLEIESTYLGSRIDRRFIELTNPDRRNWRSTVEHL